jgi:hypothetical protein
MLISGSKNFENVIGEVILSCHVLEHIVPTVAYFHGIREKAVHELQFGFLVSPVQLVLGILLRLLVSSYILILT